MSLMDLSLWGTQADLYILSKRVMDIENARIAQADKKNYDKALKSFNNKIQRIASCISEEELKKRDQAESLELLKGKRGVQVK